MPDPAMSTRERVDSRLLNTQFPVRATWVDFFLFFFFLGGFLNE